MKNSRIFKIIIIFIVFFISINVNAAELPTKKWDKYFERPLGEYPVGIYENSIYSYNDNIIIVEKNTGYSPELGINRLSGRTISSYDKNGNLNWTKYIENYSSNIQIYKNNIYVYSSYSGDLDVLSLDTGDKIYEKNFDRISSDYMIVCDDGLIFVNTAKYEYGYYNNRMYIVKIDFDGNYIWDIGKYMEENAFDSVVTFDGENLIIGSYSEIIVYNTNGTLVDSIKRSDKFPVSYVKKFNDGYLISGLKDSAPYMQFYKNGVVWEKKISSSDGTTLDGQLNSFDFNNSEIVAVGTASYESNMLPLVVSLDLNGNINYVNINTDLSNLFKFGTLGANYTPLPSQYYNVKFFGNDFVITGDSLESGSRYYTYTSYILYYENKEAESPASDSNNVNKDSYTIKTDIKGKGIISVNTDALPGEVVEYKIFSLVL